MLMTKSTRSFHRLTRNRNKRKRADTLKMILSITRCKTNTPALTAKHWQKKATPSLSRGKLGFVYKTSATVCKTCPLRSEFLAKQTPHRRVWRWEHEAFMQSYRKVIQTASAKAISKRRGAIVEHPFGTIKRSLGWDHTRGAFCSIPPDKRGQKKRGVRSDKYWVFAQAQECAPILLFRSQPSPASDS